MELDLRGRIANTRLPRSRPLLPLFEAIVNSFHAIEESGREDGLVEITVLRGEPPMTLPIESESQPLPEVIGFSVRDNGVGFTNQNYQSFLTSDSTYKRQKGGKGVGRFTWLKAFKGVDVNSVYEEGGTWHERNFKFSLEAGGVNEQEVTSTEEASSHTMLRMVEWRDDYFGECPKRTETIAQRIVDHCLVVMLSKKSPRINLYDNGSALNLNDFLHGSIRSDEDVTNFEVGGEVFNVRILELYSSDDSRQKIHWCAHEREVASEPLGSLIPDLKKRIVDSDDNSSIILVNVTSPFLDNNLNSERTEIYFDEEEGVAFSGVTKSKVNAGVKQAVESHYQGYLDGLSQQRVERVREYASNTAPQYRPLLKRPELLRGLETNVPDEKLDVELHKRKAAYEVEIREMGAEILAVKPDTLTDLPAYREKLDEYVEGINDISKATLAQYVIHRKSVLDLFDKQLSIQEDGKYPLEESVHKLIFPLRSTSDEVSYDDQNLWIIDERLAYHSYLASDIRLKSNEAIESDDLTRPDLLIFQAPLALVDDALPYTSVVIVEFKRPERDDYVDDDNPISQVYDYIRKIVEGKAKDRKGQRVSITPTTPFYCYILCDLTPKLKKYAENGGFTISPDGLGYFHFNKNFNAYMEVISYGKLISDARKRNRVLFDKLNLP